MVIISRKRGVFEFFNSYINMKKNYKAILISFLVLILCILLNYVVTDIGFNSNYMLISGIPFWLGSIIMCVLVPLCTYFALTDSKK